MKKIIFVATAAIMSIFLLCSFIVYETEWTDKQNCAHQIAELAREMGLDEDDPIILRATEIWWEEEQKRLTAIEEQKRIEEERIKLEKLAQELKNPSRGIDNYSQYDLDMIACVVYNEGAYGTTRRHRELIAQVVVNRVNSIHFPNTVYEVLIQPKQYLAAYTDYESKYMKLAVESDVWDECLEIAELACKGEIKCPSNVVYQSNYSTLGTGTYEIHKTSYSTTYFNYCSYRFVDP